jgi:hypothetical protein
LLGSGYGRLQRKLRGDIMFGIASVPAATATPGMEAAGGIERIVERGHETSCVTLEVITQGVCQPYQIAFVELVQLFSWFVGDYENS